MLSYAGPFLERKADALGIRDRVTFHGFVGHERLAELYRTCDAFALPSIVMGSYGIGIGRLLATVIERNHDEKGIIWPDPIAPFAIVGFEIADVQAAQFVRAHGEVCPASWKPGDKGLRPGLELIGKI